MPDDAIPDAVRPLLNKLRQAGNAAVRLDRLHHVLSMPLDAAAETLAELQALDLVDVWPDGHGGHPCAILSTRAAAILGVELVDSVRSPLELKWVPVGTGRDRGAYWRNELASNETDVFGPDAISGLDGVPDPHATNPLQGAIDAEDIRRPLKLGGLASTWPRILLGMRLMWPVKREKGKPCPGCGGRRLRCTEVCLVCHSLGTSDRIELPPVEKPPKEPKRPKFVPDPDGLAGGAGAPHKEPQRKAKRRKTKPKPVKVVQAPKPKAWTPEGKPNSFDLKAIRIP